MSKLTLKDLEGYLTSKDMDAFFMKMPPKSENVSYLKLMNQLHTPDVPFDQLKKSAEEFIKNKKYSPNLKTKMKIVLAFKELEAVGDDTAEAKDLLQKINKNFLNFSFSYKKPKQVETENMNLEAFGQDDYKQKEEHKLLKGHLDVVAKARESMTHCDIPKINPTYFFADYDLARVKLAELDDQLFNSLVRKVFENFGLLYPGIKEFVFGFARLNPKKISKTKNYFLNNLYKYPTAWLEELVEVEEWRSSEKFLKVFLAKKFRIATMKADEISLEKLELIKDFAKNLDPKFNLMKKYCDFQILKKKLEQGSPDKEGFKAYLENPLFEKTTSDRTRFVGQKQKEMKMQNLKRLNIKTEVSILPSDWVANHSEIIDRHLVEFFKAGGSYEEWVPFFNELFLKQMYFSTNLVSGKLPEGFDEVMSEEQVKALTDKKSLEFVEGNQKRFAKGDKVEVRLEMKNIQELKIKIFQINIESALLENLNVDFAKMDLLGLVAREELSYTYSRPPLEVWEETFHFDSIDTAERGVFIVDFITGRLSSRAVIHKGSLSLVYEKQKLGTLCWILDENKSICKGKRTGIYIGKKFFKSDNNGEIHIPFNVASKPSQVIVCHENFAVTCDLQIKDPNLQLTLDLLVNSEQLRPGHRAQFFLVPELTLFKKPLCLKNLVDPKLTISISGELGNHKRIEVPKKDLRMSNGRFFEVGTTFLAKTTSISFSLEGKVALHGKDERILSATKSLNFMTSTSRPLEQVYITTSPDGSNYVAQMRGRNGEMRKNQEFNVKLQALGVLSSSKSGLLNVNADGVKDLGSMDQIKSFELNLPGKSTMPKRVVEDTQLEYSSKVLMTTGDRLRIPVHDSSTVRLFDYLTDEKSIEFTNTLSGKPILEELSEKVKRVDANNIEIQGLESGGYILVIYCKDGVRYKLVGLRVIEGKRFKLSGKDFIEWNNSFIRSPNEASFNLLMSEDDSSDNCGKAKLLSGGLDHAVKKTFDEDKPPKQSDIQALFLCYNFLQNENEGIMNGNAAGLHHLSFDQTFMKSFSNNNYYSNKMLDEEIIYVLQRRKTPEFMGNTLDKPSILLKRKKVQATTNENLQLQKETDFGMKKASRLGGRGFSQRAKKRIAVHRQTIDLSYDFLETPGKVLSENVGADGVVQLPDEALKYNYVKCLLNIDGKIMLSRTLRKTYVEPKTVELVLAESKKVGYVYRNIRLINALTKGKAYTIENISNTEFWGMNTLEQLMKAQQTLQPGRTSQLEEWEFLARWNSMKPAEKLKTYDKFYSHELNLFVYFKDREFFVEVVEPFISNKKQKTFIDLFLLDLKEKARERLRVSRAEDLNNLEKLLLFLMFWKEPETSNLIASLHGITSLPHNRVCDNRFKTIFENLLNSRKTKETGGEEGDVARGGLIAGIVPPEMLRRAAPMNFIAQAMPTGRAYGRRAPRQLQRNRAVRHQREEMQMIQLERQASVGDFSEMEYNMEMEEEGYMNDYMEESFDIRRQEKKFREAGAKVYQPMESTAEYVEKEYYYNSDQVELTDNIFYFHLAEHVIKNEGSVKNFVNKNFLYCTSSVTEMLFVVAIMDLDFELQELAESVEGNKMVLTATQNCVLFSKEISEVKGKQLDIDFLVSQRFYDPNDRYTLLDDGTEVEKPVKEFVKGKVYGCRVVVTNSTVSNQNVSIITEIPQGSMPLNPGDSLKVHNVQINSFLSNVIDLSFYFPKEGEFTVYPATVAKEDNILATAREGVKITVKTKKEQIELESISDVLSTGKIENILAFLKDKNLRNNSVFQFSNIGWLMKNPEFYSQVVAIFRQKGIYNEHIWKFSVFHGDLATFKELLSNDFIKSKFSQFFYLKNAFLSIDNCRPKDYFPLINPRAHSIGENEANIMNKQFRTTYKNFLLYLVEKGGPSLEDRVLWVTYLLLQDRVFEASRMFKEFTPADRKSLSTEIQFDYIEAYIDFMTGFPNFDRARAVCEEYLDYPVLGWRNLFVEIANQLSEYQETELASTALLDQTKSNKQKNADLTPYLSAEMVESVVKVSFRNQSRLHLEFYRIDLEVLFTQDPFESKLNSSLTNVLPFLSQTHSVEKKTDFQVSELPLPENLKTENLLIRVLDDSKQSHLLKYIPFNLESILNEEYGILKLIDKSTNRPVPKVYVKCFAKMTSGQVRFFKDGYTDLRGSFDYASMNTSGASKATQFCLLVLSKTFGSKILHSKPPVNTMRIEGKAKKIKSKNYRGMRAKKGFKKMKYQLSDYDDSD